MDIKFQSTFCLNIKQTPNHSVGRCQTVCTSKCGMVVAAFQCGFHVFRTAAFESACLKKSEELRRNPGRGFPSNKELDNLAFDQTVFIRDKQNILFVSICCDGSTLAVVLQRSAVTQPLILFYNTRSLFEQSPTPFLQVMDPEIIPHDLPTDLIWNPDQENRLMMCLSSGTVAVITLVENGTKYAIYRLKKLKATATSWSPRGKRIMIFGEGGYLEQYDASKMTPVRLIDIQTHLPPKHNVCDILWFNNFSYILCATTKDRNLQNPVIIFVHAPKEGSLYVKSFEDVCFPSDSVSPIPTNQFYFQWCAAWRLAILMSNRASEIGVIAVAENCKDCSLLSIEEEDGVIFKDGTRFTGFTMDNTVQTRGKGPFLYGLTKDGQLLTQFMNRDPQHPSPCVQPAALPKADSHQISAQVENQSARSFHQSPHIPSSSPMSKPFSPLSSNISPAAPSKSQSLSSPVIGSSVMTSATAASPKLSSILSSIETTTATSASSNKQIVSPQINRSPRTPNNPATMRALNELVMSVSERINKSLSANRELFSTIDRELPSSARGDMKGRSTALTQLQTAGDQMERRLEALNTVTTESRNNILQLSSESAANLEYVERITVAMKHRNHSAGSLFSSYEGAPIDPGFGHHLREMHSRVDNFEMILDQANHQLDSLLSSAESKMSDRRRRQPASTYGQTSHTNGMEDPKLHQLYTALRTNAGALSVQESRVDEIAKLVDKLSNQTISNGISNGTTTAATPQQQNRSHSSSRGSSFRLDPKSERSPAARRGWSTEKDSVLMRMLSGRKDVPHVKSSPVNTSRSDDEKALYRKLDFSALEDISNQRISHATTDASANPLERGITAKMSDSQYSIGSIPKSPLANTMSSAFAQRQQSVDSSSSEKRVTFGESSAPQVPDPNRFTPAPTSILKSSTDVTYGKTFSEQVKPQNRITPSNVTVSPNPAQSQQDAKTVKNFFPSTPLSTSSASATAAYILNSTKASAASQSPTMSKTTPSMGIPTASPHIPSPVSNVSSQLGFTGTKLQQTPVAREKPFSSVSPLSSVAGSKGQEYSLTPPTAQLSTLDAKTFGHSSALRQSLSPKTSVQGASGTFPISPSPQSSLKSPIVTGVESTAAVHMTRQSSVSGLSTSPLPGSGGLLRQLSGAGVPSCTSSNKGGIQSTVPPIGSGNLQTASTTAKEMTFKAQMASPIPENRSPFSAKSSLAATSSFSPAPAVITSSFSPASSAVTSSFPPASSVVASSFSPASSAVTSSFPPASSAVASSFSPASSAVTPSFPSTSPAVTKSFSSISPAVTPSFSSVSPAVASSFSSVSPAPSAANAGVSPNASGNSGLFNKPSASSSNLFPVNPGSTNSQGPFSFLSTSQAATTAGSSSFAVSKTTASSVSSGASLFNTGSSGEQSTSLFSSKSPAESGRTSGSLFQTVPSSQTAFSSPSSTAVAVGSDSLFGNTAAPSMKLFTSTASPAQPGSLFSPPASSVSSSLFSNIPATSSTSGFGGLFGQTAKPMQENISTTQTAAASPFNPAGAQPAQTGFTSPFPTQSPASNTPTASLFGNTSNSPAGNASIGKASGPFGEKTLFGTSAASTNQSQSTNTLFGSPSQPASQSTGGGGGGLFGSPAGSLFSGLGAQAPSNPQNVFGSPVAAGQATQAAGFQQNSTLFGSSQSSPFGTNVNTSGGLFGTTASPIPAANPTSSGFGAPPAFGGSPVFGGAPAFGVNMTGTSAGFGDTRPSGGFAAIASQSSGLTFGSLAHGTAAANSPVPSPSGFGAQTAASPQMFASLNTGASPDFGGNPSFTRRRA